MRKAKIERITKETKIFLELNLDGKGEYKIKTPVSFINHMLSLFAKHGLIDLKIKAHGDVEIDEHHTIEDLGICFGQALKKALGKKEKINRYGSSFLPMDETLVETSLDISGRPYLVFNVKFRKTKGKNEFNFEILEEFFRALCFNSGLTLHINLRYGKNNHHISEAVFKSFGRALNEAVSINPRIKGIPSTKGSL